MIIEKDLHNWSDFKTLVDNSRIEWVFRGQSNAEWRLSTPIERSSLRSGIENLYPLENQILEEFKRVSQHYLKPNELPNNNIEWFALIQHYGTPTRFLDFTKSPYIAAYFAFENDRPLSNKVSIWILNKIAFYRRSIYYLQQKGIDQLSFQSELKSSMYIFSNSLFDHILKLQDIDCIFPVESYFKNERYYLQQSIFLSIGNPEKKFMEQIDFLDLNKSKAIIKINLPYDIRNEVLRDLYKMNITRASLFPGLEGYAKTINFKYSTLTTIDEYASHLDYLKEHGLL